MRIICGKEFQILTGRENVLGRLKYAKPGDPVPPVVAVQLDSNNFWEIESNDPKFTQLDELRKAICAWEHSPFLNGRS